MKTKRFYISYPYEGLISEAKVMSMAKDCIANNEVDTIGGVSPYNADKLTLDEAVSIVENAGKLTFGKPLGRINHE